MTRTRKSKTKKLRKHKGGSQLVKQGRFIGDKSIFRPKKTAVSPRKQRPPRASRAALPIRIRSPPRLNITKKKVRTPPGRVAHLYKPKSVERIRSAPLM